MVALPDYRLYVESTATATVDESVPVVEFVYVTNDDGAIFRPAIVREPYPKEVVRRALRLVAERVAWFTRGACSAALRETI